jgi:pyruvate,water dikinase
MTTQSPLTLPLDSGEISLSRAGGKGSALTGLAAAGLPVPSGFLITTVAYEDFVRTNDLEPGILEAIAGVDFADTSSAEAASKEIRDLFEAAAMPEETAAAIRSAYGNLQERRVAVRSSATAEDLPELSFAGQQDSYLNVSGTGELLAAVQRCWASLWTARAIVYRERMNIEHRAISMGVVVQIMVDANVSGILFTANPATGDRSELVVNASFGLGEAVVAGIVTPDTFVVDRSTLAVKDVVIGSKEEMIVATADQGVESRLVPADRREVATLGDERIRELAELGLKVESVRGGLPQDIEWAVVDGRCMLLQSRPITGLAEPAPELDWSAPYEGAKFIRRQVVENMPEPLSPLFEELYLSQGLDRGMDALMSAMELPFDMDEFVKRPLFVTVNGYGYLRYEFSATWRMLLLIPRVLVWYVRALPKLLRNLQPMWDEGLVEYQSVIGRWRRLETSSASDQQLIDGIRELAYADAKYWFFITMMVGSAKVTEGLLNGFLASRLVGGDLISGLFLRGFPSKTLEAQEDLVRIAAEISEDAQLREIVAAAPVEELIDAMDSFPEDQTISHRFAAYLKQYGHQVYNLDFVAPTQGEDPTPILMALQTYVRDSTTLGDLRARNAGLVAERKTLESDTAASLGRVRRWLFLKFLSWAQRFGPFREEALFHMGAAWPVLRRLALILGERLVEGGILKRADDVFYLRTDELQGASASLGNEAAAGSDPSVDPGADALADVGARRELRELRRKVHPPGRVPEDVRFKYGFVDLTRFIEIWETQKRNADDAAELSGFAVSPGAVTGVASVILSPADFPDMVKDTILVCPTTTPAWTPLFGHANALVTDIGAVLAHGSIVAREYGIPAVLGTGNATERIRSGQRIRVDGDAGTVTILDR